MRGKRGEEQEMKKEKHKGEKRVEGMCVNWEMLVCFREEGECKKADKEAQREERREKTERKKGKEETDEKGKGEETQ